MIASKFLVEESYSWDNDIMKITKQIVEETDKARLSHIAEHFEVDLSEIREFLNEKRRKVKGHLTNGDRIRSKSNEELAEWLRHYCIASVWYCKDAGRNCKKCWLEWLEQEAKDEQS